MNVNRYNVEAHCSCGECQESYVQNVIPTMTTSDNGKWVSADDFNSVLSQLEQYEEFIEFADMWDRYQEFCWRNKHGI